MIRMRFCTMLVPAAPRITIEDGKSHIVFPS